MRLITFLHGAIAVLLSIVMYMLFPAVDINIEMNEVMSKSDFLRERIAFLELVVNESIKDCTMSVVDFERFVSTRYGRDVTWRDDKFGLPSLGVIKKNSCIERISLNWM